MIFTGDPVHQFVLILSARYAVVTSPPADFIPFRYSDRGRSPGKKILNQTDTILRCDLS